MDPLHLLIVSDDPVVRAGLAQLMAELPGCEVDGQLGSADFFVDFDAGTGYPQPDIILWDFGAEAFEQASDLVEIGTPIVALLTDAERAREAWNAGIRVLLTRNSSPEKLLDAARAAYHGLIVVDSKVSRDWFQVMESSETKLVEELTPRELEVLQLLAEGLTNKAIAQRLAISEHTVKFHVNAVMSKLGAQSRTGAVVQATRQGLISL